MFFWNAKIPKRLFRSRGLSLSSPYKVTLKIEFTSRAIVKNYQLPWPLLLTTNNVYVPYFFRHKVKNRCVFVWWMSWFSGRYRRSNVRRFWSVFVFLLKFDIKTVCFELQYLCILFLKFAQTIIVRCYLTAVSKWVTPFLLKGLRITLR